MGTSNFLYRDSLYAMDTYVPADEAECTCDHDVGCEHESDCPALNGYHDEFIYDDTCQNLIQYFKDAKAKHASAVYEVTDEHTNDNHRGFEGRIVGRAYYNVDHASCTLGISGIKPDFPLIIGDNYCIRTGYYDGFNFDRLTSRYADYGCDEVELLSDDIHYRLYKYDEADINKWIAHREAEVEEGLFDTLSDACQNYGLELPPEPDLTDTDELFYYIAGIIHANIMDNVTKAIAEMDAIYHDAGKQYFE